MHFARASGPISCGSLRIQERHPGHASYQCFTDDDRKRDLHGQVEHALLERKKLLDDMQKQLPCMVGEWSCALPPNRWVDERAWHSTWPCGPTATRELINFDATRGLVLLDFEDRGRRRLELPRLRAAGLAAGKIR